MRLYSMMRDFMEANAYLPLEFFMKKYEVSRRTIQNDISYLIQMSSRKGYQLHMRRGSGYLLEVINVELLQDFIATLSCEVIFDIKDRTKNMLAFLALQDDFISMDKIATTFCISKTSVKNDRNDMDALAKRYALTLERKSHYGIRLVGSNHAFKQMLSELYFDENTFVVQSVHDVVKDFNDVEDMLIKQLEKEALNINYQELKNVIVWLKVTIFYAHNTNEQRLESCGESQSSTRRIAVAMLQQIVRKYHVQICEESVVQLEEVLRKNVRARKPSISFSGMLQQDIDNFLLEIDASYDTAFHEDQDFKASLLIHVSLLIDRLHQKISYKNTLVDELSIRYPMIFNIAILFGDMLKEKYGVQVTRDEVGFVATHFAVHMEKERKLKIQRYNRIVVVCSSGGGSAYLIKLQMETLFPQSEVETFSFLQMDDVEAFQPDLIFTIMPLNREFEVPVIFIKELLDDDDLSRIRQVLQYDTYDTLALEDANAYIHTIFDRDFFQIRKETNYLDLISYMANQLEESGYGGEHYKEYVLEREHYMSTIYLNGVAIPHPMQLSGVRNMISVCIVEQPIIENDREVQIVFMVSLTKEDYEVHKDITKILYLLMKDEKRLRRVLMSKTFEELMMVIRELDGGVL